MNDPIGKIATPQALSKFGAVESGGLGNLLNIFLNVLVVAGGVYALFNFVLAGYAFLSAGDDPKAIQGAWAKIYQTIIGLVFIAGSMVIAAIVGLLVFGDATALLQPKIPTI